MCCNTWKAHNQSQGLVLHRILDDFVNLYTCSPSKLLVVGIVKVNVVQADEITDSMSPTIQAISREISCRFSGMKG